MSDIHYEKVDKVYHVKKRRLSIKKWALYLVLPSILIIAFGLFCIFNSLSLNNKESVAAYSEVGDVDYKVYLKQNNYYEEKFLGKNMQYIASLINTINVKFNYQMHATEEMNFNYKYKVTGTLKVTDKTDKSKVLYKKNEVLLDEVTKSTQDDDFNILEEVDIDYDKYNSYVSAFRKDYALTANAELVLKMDVEVDGNYENVDKGLNSKKHLEISIPLSEQTVDIAMTASKINHSDSLDSQEQVQVENVILCVSGIIFSTLGIIGIALAIYLYLSRFSNDPYQKALHKILKEYDTYIVSAKNSFQEGNNLTRVASFQELLDAQKIEQTPILFYEVEPGNKAYFVVNGTKTTYRFTLTKAYQIKLSEEGKKGKI